MRLTLSIATDPGSRDEHEDRFFAGRRRSGALLGIFDGHGGDEAANTAAKELPAVWTLSTRERDPKRRIFTVIEKLATLVENERSGTTASIVWIPKNGRNVYVGVLGDSPVMVRRSDGGIWIAPEHNVGRNVRERDAAVARGAIFLGGYACYDGRGIQLSRTLGDAALSRILQRKPQVFTVPIDRGSIVLAASDGIFTSEDYENVRKRAGELFDFILSHGREYAAGLTVGDAIRHGTHDNVTAAVCSLS